MRVRIKKCFDSTYWYNNFIGNEYEVEEYTLDESMYIYGLNTILKSDCEVIEEPKQIIDLNGIQTEPFTNEQKKVIAVEKDCYKVMLWNDMLASFKTADELQRIALLEIFEEMGYPNSQMVKLYRKFQNEL